MATKWVEQGWVSVRDLDHLGWSNSAIDRLKAAVPEVPTGIPALGKARDLAEVNGWARDNGESIVSSKGLKSPKVRRADHQPRKRGQHPKSRLKTKTYNRPSATAQATRAAQSVQAQLSGHWFSSKKEAHAAGFLSAKDLDSRLWTESLISKLLGEPGGFGENYYGPMPTRYWSIDAMLALEAGEEFSKAMATSLNRRRISWAEGISAIAGSNRELQLQGPAALLPWSVILGERLPAAP